MKFSGVKIQDTLEGKYTELNGCNGTEGSELLEERNIVVVGGNIPKLVEDGVPQGSFDGTLDDRKHGIGTLNGTIVIAGNAGGVDVCIRNRMIFS